jgi:hypothetical protein
MLAERGFDILDRMEIAIFAQQRVAKRGEKLFRIAARAEIWASDPTRTKLA